MPTQADHVVGLRNQSRGGRGFGLPSATRFQSGHLPSGIIPVSRGMPVKNGAGIGSESDMDTSSDSDSEAYGGRYSVETSPQDDKFVNGVLFSKAVNSFYGEDNVTVCAFILNIVHFAGKHQSNFRSLGAQGIRSIDASVPDLRNGTSEVCYFNGNLQPNAKTPRQVFRLNLPLYATLKPLDGC